MFYLTPSIEPSWKKLKQVIEFSGGSVFQHRRKDIDEIKEMNKPGADPNYIIIAEKHDIHLVADVLQAKIGIYTPELVLGAVLRGYMDFDLKKYITTY